MLNFLYWESFLQVQRFQTRILGRGRIRPRLWINLYMRLGLLDPIYNQLKGGKA
jgi:hypothetical protein